MTVGEHLEELRRRLLIGLAGFFIALVVCLIFGTRVILVFCAPLYDALQIESLNPELYFTELGGPFMVYLKISVISALALSSPWMLYQLWLFVAAGLYPHERKYVVRYTPLSIALLIGGMLFVYFLVLPWTIRFFITFAGGIPIPERQSAVVTEPYEPLLIPSLPGDPANPRPFELWYNNVEGRLKYRLNDQTRVIPFSPSNLLAPMITLPEYVNLVLAMLILFGLSFQMPLVVMALGRIGLVEVDTLKSSRRYVYFALSVLSAVLTPAADVVSMIILLIPLMLLYEMGIWMAQLGGREEPTE